ncbi:MAG: hypothetical protein ABFS28_05350 [Bacteroidota bacterium]
MMKKRPTLFWALLIFPSTILMAGTYRPKDGILSFILLLGFLIILLGIIHLVDLIRSTLRNILKELNFEDLF